MSRCPGVFSDIGKKARDVIYEDPGRQSFTRFQNDYFNWNLDLSCENEILPGLATSFRFNVPEIAKVELRFRRDYIGITAGGGLKALRSKNEYHPFLCCSGVIGTNLFRIGAKVAYDTAERKLDQINAGLSIGSQVIINSLTLLCRTDKLEAVRVSSHYTMNPLTRTAIAAELKHSFSDNGKTAITVGAQHALFPFLLTKVRVNTNAKTSAFVQVDLWEKVRLAISAEMDLGSSDKISRVGMSLSL